MWKPSRKEDEIPMPQEPATKNVNPMPTPPAPQPPARVEPHRSEVATIGKSVIVKGELSGSEDLFVDGEVDGSIALRGQSLTIGPNGRVRANVEARNVIIHGKVDGDVKAAERVDLRKSASLTGDISSARISIEEGAYFKGAIDIQRGETAAKVEAKPPQAAAAASVVAPPVAQGSLLDSKKL